MDVNNSIRDAINNKDINDPAYFCYKLYADYLNKKIRYDNANFYVLSSNSDIERIAKVATLMPSTITFTNYDRIVTQIDHGLGYEVYCHLPCKKLLEDCRSLFLEGIIQYYPNIEYYIFNPDGTEGFIKKIAVEDPSGIIEITQGDCHANMLDCALSLDIPYIHDISISDYSDIVIGNADSLHNFRRLFKKEILKIDFSNKAELADFEYTLHSEVNKLGEQYKKDCSLFRKSLVVGTLATIATSLMVFSDMESLLKCVMGVTGGTGLLKLIDSVYDFHIQKTSINSNDYYFLWIIKNALKHSK